MKYPNKHMKLSFSPLNHKLLHLKHVLIRINYAHLQPSFKNARMDFYMRKVLKENGIPYSYFRQQNALVICDGDVPFKLQFTFDKELGYTSIKRIHNNFEPLEFNLLAPTVQKLWDKMFLKGIICNREHKRLIVSQALTAQQLRSR
jgi:hypothetical protein